jgi:hypothetical protein
MIVYGVIEEWEEVKKIFANREDAERYLKSFEGKYNYPDGYWIKEYTVE